MLAVDIPPQSGLHHITLKKTAQISKSRHFYFKMINNTRKVETFDIQEIYLGFSGFMRSASLNSPRLIECTLRDPCNTEASTTISFVVLSFRSATDNIKIIFMNPSTTISMDCIVSVGIIFTH